MSGKRTRAQPPAQEAQAAPVTPVAIVAAGVVREGLAAVMFGMSVGQIRRARRDGRWAEGQEWHRDVSGAIWIDVPAVEACVRRGIG